MIYLDNAATTCVCAEAAEIAYKMMTECYGNPSSSHQLGRNAKAELESARGKVAATLGAARPAEVFFTSCGTESDNWAIINSAEYMRRAGKHIITSMVEHDAVLKSMAELEKRGFEVTYLSPEHDGSISPDSVAAALRDDTVLVSLMMVNNETGGITDIAAVKKAMTNCLSRALLHTDAVQGFLKVPFAAKSLGADLISVSGHKIHAPKGIGALYIRSGIKLPAMIVGGGQENGLRSGTESLPLIAAFGEAASIGLSHRERSIAHMSDLRAHALSRLTDENPGLVVIDGEAAHILSISLPGYKSEVIMNLLDSKGICVSKSSACKKGRRSHVLDATGYKNDVIDGAVRISLSRYTTADEVDALCDGIKFARESLLKVLR